MAQAQVILSILCLLPQLGQSLVVQANTASVKQQRWLVTFKSRSFDLKAYRSAIRGSLPLLKMDRLLADLEIKAERERDSFAVWLEGLGGKYLRSWWICNVSLIEVPAARLQALRKHENVLFVHADELVRPARVSPLPWIDRSTNTQNHAVDSVHSAGIKGLGMTVAVIDSGQDSNMGTSGRPHSTYYMDGDIKNVSGGGIGGSRLIANIKVGTQPADNATFHGTGVAGVLAGEKWNAKKNSDRGHAAAARIIGYSVADTPSGIAKASTLISAWQQVASDKVRFGIQVANNSYLGSPDPLNAVQQAIDSVSFNADILITTPAGNSDALTLFSQSNCNGLAVAATHSDSRKIAVFSSRGPLQGDLQRSFPDISAVGVAMTLPRVDDESSEYVESGTSMAAPQVGGSAALFRSVNKKASALETKAALLVTTDDISAANPNPPLNSRNAYGMGYLRTDWLIDFAKGRGLLASSKLATRALSASFAFDVVKGKRYAVVATWHRETFTNKNWSDLDLSVLAGQQVIASSKSSRNLYEKVRFTAVKSGRLQLRVDATKLTESSVEFAIAAFETPRPFKPGSVLSYGKACAGSGTDRGVKFVTPQSYAKRFAKQVSAAVLGNAPHRFQQIIAAKELPSSFTATGIAFRQDDVFLFANMLYSVELELALGMSALEPAEMSEVFSENISGQLTTVFKKRIFKLPVQRTLNPVPTNWTVRIPFDRPYTYKAQAGKHLIFQAVKSRNVGGSLFNYYYLDAVNDKIGMPASALEAIDLNASKGQVARGSGLIIGFLGAAGSGGTPYIDYCGFPTLTQSTTIRLEQARAAAPTALMLGFSNKLFNNVVPLPAELAAIGAPGCWLLASLDLLYTSVTDKNGADSQVLTIPDLPVLIGHSIYFQQFVLDTSVNKLGMVFTNGLELKIGG